MAAEWQWQRRHTAQAAATTGSIRSVLSHILHLHTLSLNSDARHRRHRRVSTGLERSLRPAAGAHSTPGHTEGGRPACWTLQSLRSHHRRRAHSMGPCAIGTTGQTMPSTNGIVRLLSSVKNRTEDNGDIVTVFSTYPNASMTGYMQGIWASKCSHTTSFNTNRVKGCDCEMTVTGCDRDIMLGWDTRGAF